eukprot:GAHX01002896.1.p1 GENE.GAHX01002896.1~~GAHX01002896.1.p1  ORF type:complete len:125 (+),score=15.04 GAHX01002896.1:309-683(+)
MKHPAGLDTGKTEVKESIYIFKETLAKIKKSNHKKYILLEIKAKRIIWTTIAITFVFISTCYTGLFSDYFSKSSPLPFSYLLFFLSILYYIPIYLLWNIYKDRQFFDPKRYNEGIDKVISNYNL